MKQIKEMVQNIINDIQEGVEVTQQDIDDGMYDCDYEVGDTISAYDYLSDVLDIEYVISSDGEYRGARVLVAFGGPNIWINTRTQQVEGYWWSDSCVMSYGHDAMDLDGTLQELWECR